MTGSSINRSTTLWLLAITLLVTLPLFPVLPYSVLAIICGCGFWRFCQQKSLLREPPSLVKVGIVLISSISIYSHFGEIAGLDTAAAVLTASYALKLLELKTLRDAWILLLMGFFLAVTGLLYSQSLLMTSYVLVTITTIVSAMASLYFKNNNLAFALKQGMILSLQTLPFMFALFILVPRIPPLWSVPTTDKNAMIGLSDSITPGDIAQLSQSDELVFRATFKERTPPPEQRYWRSIVMSHFDGSTWSQQKHNDLLPNNDITIDDLVRWHPTPSWLDQPVKETPAYQYDIIQEPSGKNWLFSLGPAYQSVAGSGITYNYRLIAREPINLRKAYSQKQIEGQETQDNLPYWLTQLNLQRPPSGNELSQNLGRKLAIKHQSNPLKIANELMTLFRTEQFFYTLKPLTLGKNAIDEFLFDTKQGFCSHYAGAFVYIMRAAGVPARLIAGYQGGELKEQERVIQVRQFDAHAWAEIWVPNQGWLRVDPTAAVSPERISQGLETAVAEEGTFLANNPLSPIHFRHIALFNQMRLSWEYIEHQWQRSVLDYHQKKQEALFREFFGDRDIYISLAILLGIIISLLLLIICIILFWPKKNNQSELEKLYTIFCRVMAKKGFDRQPKEGPITFGNRIIHLNPELYNKISHITLLFSQLIYAQNINKNIYQKLKDELKSLKKQVKI